jgi:hypothetical protein
MRFTRFNIAVQTITFLVFAVVAFLSYQKNFFGFSEKMFFENFDHFSESLVVGDIVADQFGLEKHGWNLGFIGAGDAPLDTTLSYKVLDEKSVNSSIKFSPYPSQLGIQGLFFSGAYKFLGKPSVETLNALNSLLMALVIALLSILYLRIYDKAFGMIFFFTMIGSPWTISFARNLYWVPFTWFLPAVFAALAYLSQGRVTKLFFLTCVLFSVAIKSLAGYEYLTTITIFACSVFVLAPLFGSDNGRRSGGIKFASFTFLSCILGFVFALILHASMRGDSVSSGLQNIYQMDVKRRTYGDPTQFDSVFRASLESSFFDVLNTYWSLWQTPLSIFIPGDYLGVIFWLFVIGAIYGILTKRGFSYREPAMVLVFFTASASWFLFGKAHSYIHTQLNYVLWYFGFIQALLYCLVRFGFLIVADILKLAKRLGFIVSSMLGLVVLFLVTASLTKYIDDRMSIITSGIVEPVDVGPGVRLIFREDGKMVFYATKCRELDLSGFVILHFIPENMELPIAKPHGFENRDFVWQKSINWNPFSKHFGSCYTEVLLPSYRIREIRTGQYDVSKTGSISIRCERLIRVPSFPSLVELIPYNLTDQNWENGICRERAGFFIENTIQNRMGLSDSDTIELPFSGRRAIAFIEYTDKFINVYLEGPNLDPTRDGYPNKLSIKR